MSAEYVKLHTWFEIHHVIKIFRSFASDELDFLYVDRMARFVKLAAPTGVLLYQIDVNSYYLRYALLCRRWSRFGEAPDLLKVIKLWHTFRLLVPAQYLIFKYVEKSASNVLYGTGDGRTTSLP